MAAVKRAAVVLFNLGGPDSLDAVKPFLFNLFSDPAIIGAPGPIRWAIAKLISSRRAPVAREIYRQMGGASPIVAQTEDQAKALAARLRDRSSATDWRVEIAMRYWHPFADETARRVKAFDPERIVLLPLYPQYSGTTSGSSAKDWRRAAAAGGLAADDRLVCCYPDQGKFIAAQLELIGKAVEDARATHGDGPLRILLSAHGLPKKVVAGGDPYQWQVERSSTAITEGLRQRGLLDDGSEVVTCYQSRVGPLEWIGPSTDGEIARAGADGRGVVIAPIAFVSEHSETLVELDIEYAALAKQAGVPHYTRVPAVGCHDGFIDGLADLVLAALDRDDGAADPLSGMVGQDRCDGGFGKCPRCPAA